MCVHYVLYKPAAGVFIEEVILLLVLPPNTANTLTVHLLPALMWGILCETPGLVLVSLTNAVDDRYILESQNHLQEVDTL